MALSLDGAPTATKLRLQQDRQFLRLETSDAAALSAGKHSLVFAAARAARPTLCHIMVHAFARGFGGADGGDRTRGAVGIFPVFSRAGRRIGYRPTQATGLRLVVVALSRRRPSRRLRPAPPQDSCLMREMLSSTLCPICTEALWRNLLSSAGAAASRISLLHWVRLSSARRGGRPSAAQTRIEAAVAPLGAFRRARVPTERLRVRLFPHGDGAAGEGVDMPQSGSQRAGGGDGATAVELLVPRMSAAARERCWRVAVEVSTAEVRSFAVQSELCFCEAEAGLEYGEYGLQDVSREARCVPCGGSGAARVRHECPLSEEAGAASFGDASLADRECTVPLLLA